MVRRDGAEVRKERIQEITKFILSSLHEHGELSLSKTLAILEYKIGLTKPKLKEYITLGAETERFILDSENDKIKPITENYSNKEGN